MPANKKKTIFSNENMPIFLLSLHRHLWNFLSFHPGMTKEEAIREMKRKNLLSDEEMKSILDSENLCVSCQYAKTAEAILGGNFNRCKDLCPLAFYYNGTCLGGKYYDWENLSNSSRVIHELDKRIKENNPERSDLYIMDGEDNLPIEDYVTKYTRKGYDWNTALQDRISRIDVQCMIAASNICCMPVKTGVKTDED